MGEIEIMTDDDAKDVAKAIEKIINRKKIHISVDKAKRIVATLKMMEAVGYSLEPDIFANPATCAIPSMAPIGMSGSGIYPNLSVGNYSKKS